jgi:hypothetical protein
MDQAVIFFIIILVVAVAIGRYWALLAVQKY